MNEAGIEGAAANNRRKDYPVRQHQKRIWLSIPVLLLTMGWMTLIFMFSAQKGEASGGLSRLIAEPLSKLLAGLNGHMDQLQDDSLYLAVDGLVRSAAHFCEYAVLGSLLVLLFRCMRVKLFWVPWLTGVLFAMTDEWHQAYVPGRVCDGMDLIIDGLGVITGVIICNTIINLWRKKHVSDF